MATVTAVEAKDRFNELLDRVASGEEIIITRREQPVARIVPESLSENSVLGSTGYQPGYQPVPSGDPPDGMGRASQASANVAFEALTTVVPVGGSPTGAGGSPAPPIFQTGSEASVPNGDNFWNSGSAGS